jgi:hypothetical protein
MNTLPITLAVTIAVVCMELMLVIDPATFLGTFRPSNPLVV